jgi:hypothetical protein
VTSGSGNHNISCATAKGHVCCCTGCGGSLHGWEGWVSLANEVDTRQSRRQQVEVIWRTHYHPPQRRSNKKSREASTDLARLDIADWLADQGATAHPHPTGDTPHVEVPAQRLPHNAIIEARKQPESDNQPTKPLGDAPESYESLPGKAKPDDGSKNLSRPEPQYDVPPYPSVVDQVRTFAEAMTKSIWTEIAAELGDDTSAREIKRQLAHHGWCDLFIGLVLLIEDSQEALDKIPESAKSVVKWAILNSSMKAERPDVTEAVVDVVVDRVWQASREVMFTHIPLLNIITIEDTVRSLRILAVFTCPAPENHKEVREHALKPLGDDAEKILTEQTKTRLAKLFDEWTTGGGNSASADLALATP